MSSTWIVSAGFSRSTRQPRAILIRPPTSRSICGDVSGNRLSARRADTRKLGGIAVAENRQNLVRQLVDIGPGATRARKVGDAEDASQAVPNLLPVGRRSQHDFDPAHQSPDGGNIKVRRGLAEVAHELTDEPRAVPALQGDLLVVNEC